MNTWAADLWKIDQTQNEPLYKQIQGVLRSAVADHVLRPDDALPPERELATKFGVSRLTVRKAIEGLVSEGVLDTQHGSGTFVRSKVEKNFAQLTSFSEEIRARGMEPSSRLISQSVGRVRPEEALTMRASPSTEVYRFNRLRLADGSPMAVEYATVLASCLLSLEALDNSLYQALHETGNGPTRALQRLSAILLKDTQAKLLGAAPKSAGLLVERVGFNASGTAVEFTQSYYRGDVYDFVAELSVE